jgi:hypothetical protein
MVCDDNVTQVAWVTRYSYSDLVTYLWSVMRRLTLVLSAVVVVLFTWSACAAASSAKTAEEILQLSVGSMRVAGSFHYTSTTSIGGKVALSLSTDSSLKDGVQIQKLDGGTETTLLIGKKLFMKANEKAYAEDFGVKNSALANKWVLVPTTNKNYSNIAEAILVPSVMQELVDIGSITDAGEVTVAGQRAYALKGNAGASGIEYIYVSLTKPYLPLGVSAQATENGKKLTNELVFSKWGEQFKVSAPSRYVVATTKTFP